MADIRRTRTVGRTWRWAVSLGTVAVLGWAVWSPPGGAASGTGEAAPVVAGHVLTHRWLYIATNFQVAANVTTVNALLDRAKAAGYNGALLGDVKLGRLDDGSLIPAYYTNLKAVLDHGHALGLTLVPGTADFGYSETILWHDPNLAEGLPVRGAEFRAEGGLLVPYESAPVDLANGDFEQLPPSGDQFPGWAFQDQPGQATFVDRAVKHGGRASLRMVDLGTTNAPYGNGRVYQRLKVEPYRAYHVSVWVKTAGFQGGEVRALVLAQSPSRTLQWNEIPVQATQDWTRFDVIFNTLTHSEVLFYLGVWGGRSGTIWWDDAALEPAGFVNLIRRPGAPLTLTSADGSLQYAEGRDVEPVADPHTGRVPYNGVYDLWHEPPTVRLAAGSRIRDGDVVQASYYHTVSIYGYQVAASLTEPKVFDIVRGQLGSIRREFARADAFSGWMLGYDEIRVHGWDDAPKAGAGTPGEDLAASFRTVYGDARAIDPQARLYAWSDMFDPYHNAADTADPYYLVNGNWSGSWSGVPPDVTILNWNSQPAKRRDSAAFFAGRGHAQILAGYYDAPPGQFGDRQWLEDLTGVSGIIGVMYTQWGSGYGNLEAWAQHVWGDAPWVTPTPPAEPSATSGPATTAPPPATMTRAPATGTPTVGPVVGRAYFPRLLAR
jgi:hypothetical protein